MTLRLSESAWRAQGERLFGRSTLAWRFICPSCGHVASVADWLAAGASEGAIAFSCIGRWSNDSQARSRSFKMAGGPCDYAGGGLFSLNPIEVVRDDTHTVTRLFDFFYERGGGTPSDLSQNSAGVEAS